MSKAIPVIITNSNVLLYDEQGGEFKPFSLPGIASRPNIPFYHFYAKKIAEGQHYFKEFVKKYYQRKPSKNILAIIVPDDTSPLESIFINEFFVNSGACKAVAQMTMGQALQKKINQYISVSKSSRNIVLQYIRNNEIQASRYYDCNEYNVERIKEDAKRLHIDIEYENTPVFVNNFNLNMDDFFDMGEVITPKQFMDKIAAIDVEKI